MPNAELIAVCDNDSARADQAAAQYGVKSYHDYKDLLASAELDGIIIATPHYDHPPLALLLSRKTSTYW